MGFTAPDTAGAFCNWGNPAFMASPTQLLVAWWIKVSAWTGTAWGPCLYKTDFATGGWWIFPVFANNHLRIQTYGTAPVVHTVADAPIAAQGWMHVAFWATNAPLLRTYRNGVPTNRTPGTGLLTPVTDKLEAIVGSPAAFLAELSMWARSDGALTIGVADAIVAKLADPGHAQREAGNITDLAVNFYAPFRTHVNDTIGPITALDSIFVNAADHPWTASTSRRTLTLLGVS